MTCCDLVDDGSGIFKPMSKRWCTDILCLLIFVVYSAAMFIVMGFSLANGQINYLLYPYDYQSSFCGLSGSRTSGMSKAFYPRLSQDLIEQASLFTTPSGFVNFRPYTLCVSSCPRSFSLTSDTTYGGPSYPGAASDAPSYYVLTGTDEFFNRCLPRQDTNPALNRDICGAPACGSSQLVTCLGHNISCAVIDSSPSVTTTWVVDTSNATQTGCCNKEVKEANTQRFLPKGTTAQAQADERRYATWVSQALGIYDSFIENRTQILVTGLALPFALAMVWFVLLFLFAGILVLIALLFFLACLVGATIYFFYMSQNASSTSAILTATLGNFSAVSSIPSIPNAGISSTAYAILAVIFTVLTLLYIVFVVLSRQAIFRCIAIIREVTKVFFALPFMCVWPLVSVVLSFGVVAYAVGIGGFIMTQNRDQNTFASMHAALNASGTSSSTLSSLVNQSPEVRIAILATIHFVGCIWWYFCVMSSSYTTLSRACAVWFFSHGVDEASGEVKQKGSFFFGTRVVLVCFWCVIWKHLGSIAFGSAILTLMTVLRIVLNLISYYTKDLQKSNCLLRMVICCTQCCLYCLDRTVKFITYYGYIFVAIEGSTFCGACISTFGFIMKYPSQMGVNRMVANLLSCLISLSIPFGCAFVGFIWIDQMNPLRPQPATAAVFIFLLSYVVASSITDVFKCCIDTIFVCAFKDLEEHTPPKFMSTALRAGFGLDDAAPSGVELKSGPAVTSSTDDKA